MKDNLEVIVVPSGNEIDDSIRISAAFLYAEQARAQGKEVRYILSGVGPNLNEGLQKPGDYSLLFPYVSSNNMELDIHPKLYNETVGQVISREVGYRAFEPFGVDTQSLNSIDNMVNTFPPGTEGNYTIVSRALHNARFRLIERELRKSGYLSPNLKLNYVNTSDSFSLRNIVYDLMALVKFFAKKGKIKDSTPV